MASSSVRLLAALCSIMVLATLIGSTQSVNCCLKYSKRPLPCRLLLGYTVQTINGYCDISAIIFHISKRFVCADPSKHWTQRAMKCVDELKRKNGQLAHERTNATAALF